MRIEGTSGFERIASVPAVPVSSPAQAGKSSSGRIADEAPSFDRQLGSVLLPSVGNARKIATKLADAWRDTGEFPLEASAKLTQDGALQFEGRDGRALGSFVESRPELERDVRNMLAIASHAAGIESSLAFQAEYRAADNPAQLAAAIAKYGAILSGEGMQSPSMIARWSNGTAAISAA